MAKRTKTEADPDIIGAYDLILYILSELPDEAAFRVLDALGSLRVHGNIFAWILATYRQGQS